MTDFVANNPAATKGAAARPRSKLDAASSAREAYESLKDVVAAAGIRDA